MNKWYLHAADVINVINTLNYTNTGVQKCGHTVVSRDQKLEVRKWNLGIHICIIKIGKPISFLSIKQDSRP